MFDAMDGNQPTEEHLNELRAVPMGDLEETYRQLDALESAVRTERLQVLAVLDELEVGRADGSVDTPAWVADTSSVTRLHARQLVETARALIGLPAIRDAAARGELSWDQLEPLAQVAKPETDEDWALRAPGWTPAQLIRAASDERRVTEAEANDRHAERSLTWRWDHKKMLQIRGRLPDVAGAALIRAIERLAEPVTQDADGRYESFEARCADALGELVSQRLVDDSDPDRACLVVHAPAATLTEGSTAPGAELADVYIPIAIETLRRLACDATLQLMLETPDGAALATGRRTRTVPAAMRRAIRRRDRHCRFPGCNRVRFLHVHHVIHHADGGVTELWNLILLCPHHHRFVHEHGWRIKGDPAEPDGIEFHSPDGRRLGGPRPPLRPDVRTRFLQPV
jgi:hypothetical protein